MFVAQNGQIPPRESLHDPDMVNIDKETVAMILAKKGNICDIIWNHDPELKDKNNMTVRQMLYNNCLPIPNQWYDSQYKDKKLNPKQMQWAIYGLLIDKPDDFPAEYQNCDGFTVAMCLAMYKIQIPYLWRHNPEIQNCHRYTVAMLIAQTKSQVQACWHHRPELQNEKGQTVAMITANNGQIPDSCWNHDPQLKDNNGDTVGKILKRKKLNVPDFWKCDDLQEQETKQNK